MGDSSFDQFSALQFGEGYQIHVTQPCTLTISGQTHTTEQNYVLKAGWNLISVQTTGETTVSQTLNNLKPGIDYDEVKSYNKSVSLFENVSSANVLNCGEALYIYCLKDGLWHIPAEQQTTVFTYDGDGGRVKQHRAKGIEQSETTYVGRIFSSKEFIEKMPN